MSAQSLINQNINWARDPSPCIDDKAIKLELKRQRKQKSWLYKFKIKRQRKKLDKQIANCKDTLKKIRLMLAQKKLIDEGML